MGGVEAKSFLTPAEYQTAFDTNTKAGRRLVYLNAYTHGSGPRISAIWNEKPSVSLVARHGLSASQYQSQFDAESAQGFLTRAVTGYEEANSARFAAFWTK